MDRSFVTLGGTGPPVVLIHGVGLDCSMWDPVADALTPHFEVLRYDIIGHGATPALDGPLTFAHLTGQLDRILTDYGKDSVALVGFSLGALIAQAFVLEHPRTVNKLVLLNSACERSPEQQAAIQSRLDQAERCGVGANADASLRRWFSDGFRAACPDVVERIRNRLSSNDREGFLSAYRLFARSDRAFTDRLDRVSVPTLVITGSEDVGSTPRMSRAIASRIPGAEVRIFTGAKHMLPVESADELIRALRVFL